MWMALGALLGCMSWREAQVMEADPLERTYGLELQARFETWGEDGLRVEVSPVEVALGGWVRLSPVGGFSDSSLATVLVFEDVRVVSGAGAGLPHGLTGRAARLRTFRTGEILAVEELIHLSGPGRGLDALDVLLPLLSPKPPVLEPGEVVTTATSYPVRFDRERGVRQELAWEWTAEAGRASEARSFRHEGQLRGEGRDGEVQVAVAGRSSGALQLDAARHVVAHALEADRTVALRGPGGALIQRQVITASITLESITEPSPPRSPLYLDRAAFRTALHQGLSSL